MKVNMKKTMIIGVIALFISASVAPLIAATPTQSEETYAVEYAMVNADGSLSEETILLNAGELSLLQLQLSDLFDLLKSTTDKGLLINLLLKYLNGEDFPLLSKIVTYVLGSEMLQDRQLVISEGWGYDLNPFKKMSTDFVKPVTFWKYGELSELFPVPSTTAVLKLSPFEVETYTGSQLGFMLRFHGIYIHIPQQMPMQSFTFFLGSAKYVFGAEVPAIEIPSF
jgi:hypothetical protein